MCHPWRVSQPQQPIESTMSYARRVGDQVKVVITLPDALQSTVGRGLTRKRVWLRFRHQVDEGHSTLRAPVTVDDSGDKPVLVAEIAAAELPPSVWNLALRVGAGDGGTVVPLEARLLISDRQPIALLAGPRPDMRMPEPAPR